MLGAVTVATLLASTCPSPEAAVDLEPYEVVARRVYVRVRDGVARVELRLRLRHEGRAPAERSLPLYFDGSTSIAVDASLRFAGRTRGARWDDAMEASERFREYVDALWWGAPDEEGPWPRGPRPWERPPEPALLVEHEQEGVQLHVAGPCEQRDLEARVTLLVASEPHEGGWRFPMPSIDDDDDDGDDDDDDDVHWTAAAPAGTRARFSPDHAHLDVEPVRAPRLRARWGHAAVSLEREEVHLARAEVDLGRPLTSAAPVAFVFVIDRSVSFGTARVQAAYAFARTVLEEAPRGSAYAVVELARRAKVRVAPWTPAAERRPLTRAARGDALENGSDLAGAVRYAQAIARDAPGGLSPRVVVLTDARAPFAQEAGVLVEAFALDEAATTHLVQLSAASGAGPAAGLSWERVFTDALDTARAPERTGGIWVRATLGDEGDPRSLARHLVRPTRLDRPQVLAWRPRGPVRPRSAEEGGVRLGAPHERALVLLEQPEGGLDRGGALPPFLQEGEGVRLHALLPEDALGGEREAAPRLVGFLWAEHVEIPLRPTAETTRLAVALSAGNEVAEALSDDELLRVAAQSGAVSRVSSRVHVPAWRPAPKPALGGSGGSACGCVHRCGTHCGLALGDGRLGAGGKRDTSERDAWLRARLARITEGCATKGAALPTGALPTAARLEVDAREILDVTLTPARSDRVARCIEEAIWLLRLDEEVPPSGAWWFGAHERLSVPLVGEGPAADGGRAGPAVAAAEGATADGATADGATADSAVAGDRADEAR